MKSNLCAVFFASASMLALAACSGGGGGNSMTGGGPVVTPPTPSVSITGVTALGYGGGAPTEAAGATPNFGNSLPPNGTVFALDQAAITVTTTSANGINAGAGTATLQGTVTSGGVNYPLIDLRIPNLAINATGLRGDGTAKIQPDGSSVSVFVTGLTYTLLGTWNYKPANNSSSTIGVAIAGYQTPAGSVPTTGTATYIGAGGQNTGPTAGGVVGSVVVPSGSGGISAATLEGNVNLSVNFATQQASGTLTNMTAKNVVSGVSSPWNNVTLTGTLSQSAGSTNRGAIITGTTQAQAAPAGATFGMSSSATGVLSGALFGPNASEAGAVWSVNEGSGANGKTAFGIFGATKQ
ncbi:MAG: hypothetical protein V4559_03020 [Pseudomonadota bacterium]